jgi:hypothetical protein
MSDDNLNSPVKVKPSQIFYIEGKNSNLDKVKNDYQIRSGIFQTPSAKSEDSNDGEKDIENVKTNSDQ